MAADYRTLLGLLREFVDHDETVDDRFYSAPNDLIARARAAIQPSAPKPTNDPKIIHIGVTDECCRVPFAKDAREGKCDSAMTWNCPKCGTEWKMLRADGCAYHWRPFTVFVDFKI